MIAKIGRGANILGALAYNQLKVDQQKGQIIATHKIIESPDGTCSLSQLRRSFEPYLIANKRTEKPALHISLNSDPSDKVTDETFRQIARDYMERMGYAEQPYIVYKHTDTGRTHIHIVSTCVDRFGKKIPDTYEKLRSMDACRQLEQKFDLVPATEKQRKGNDALFRPVDYKAGDIKSQIAAVVRYLPKYYQYQGMGAYNALLSLFNITSEEIKGELHGQPKNGLIYFALDEQGTKTGNPFKASLFGKDAGLTALQAHFTNTKEKIKGNPARAVLKNTIEAAMHMATDESDFKKQLLDQGINTVIRRNDEGRIYGMTFIDHESRTVWNGSQLSENLSANIFNDWWKDSLNQPDQDSGQASVATRLSAIDRTSIPEEKEETHALFDFLSKKQPSIATFSEDLIDGLGGLLPETLGEDHEEIAFANRMKKRKRKRKRN